ncbi:MAG: hypothetical protein ACREJC_20865 [Tepidisphaeraceae bacterium]
MPPHKSEYASGERAWLILVLGVALILRVWKLDQPLMWVDEAESSINALTILEHGAPVDHYLGLPLYENMLTRPWPGNPEYEFRDTSYSSKGVAVYHGWLPLYTIAASLKAFGIEPDTDPQALRAKYSDAEISRRTIAARLPSALFGVAFLWLIFLTAREMYGRDAAWAALVTSTIAVPLIDHAREARYYAATLALSMACCLMIWRTWKFARRRDFALAALTFVLLFYTNLLTFLIAGMSYALLGLFMLKRRGALLNFCLFAAIVAAATGPWIVMSGFLESASDVPKARHFLILPDDLFMYPKSRLPVTLLLTATVAWVAVVNLLRTRLPRRMVAPFQTCIPAVAFLAAWGVIGFVAFMFVMPVASFWFSRAYLGIVGPGIVLTAFFLAGIGRMVGPRLSLILGSAMFVAFILIDIRKNAPWTLRDGREGVLWAIDEMRRWELSPGTRIYSTPSHQLTLMYYTGVPVQSIAPVRREFLDRCPSDVVLIEAYRRLLPIGGLAMSIEVARDGVRSSPLKARHAAELLSIRGVADVIQSTVAGVNPAVGHLSSRDRRLIDYQQAFTAWRLGTYAHPVTSNPLVFRGFATEDYGLWWQVFFYRFVDPQSRTGPDVNYAGRMRNAEALVLPSLWVIYHSPGNSGKPRNSLAPRK